MSLPATHHGVLVARYGPSGWAGALIRGPSGRGKSDLALRLLARGWRLVADDRVVIWASGRRLWGRAPPSLSGLLELRAVGVLPFPALPLAPVIAVIECAGPGQVLERSPQDARIDLCGMSLAQLMINPLEPSAAEKVHAYCTSCRL